MTKLNSKNIYPLPVDVEEGKLYYWCPCGLSNSPPLCDKIDSCAQAIPYTATLNETVYFCSCRRTQNPPFCDGSHARFNVKSVE